jgi:hypothetical protein
MAQPHLDVDPEQLRAGASRITDAAEAVRTAAGRHSLAPAQGQATGWSTADAARGAATAWGDFLGRMAGSVAQVATSVTTSAEGYTAADAGAAARLRNPYAE